MATTFPHLFKWKIWACIWDKDKNDLLCPNPNYVSQKHKPECNCDPCEFIILQYTWKIAAATLILTRSPQRLQIPDGSFPPCRKRSLPPPRVWPVESFPLVKKPPSHSQNTAVLCSLLPLLDLVIQRFAPLVRKHSIECWPPPIELFSFHQTFQIRDLSGRPRIPFPLYTSEWAPNLWSKIRPSPQDAGVDGTAT